MAEDTGIAPDEAAELEKLLEDADAKEAKSGFNIKRIFNKLLADKKLLLIVGVGLLLLLTGIGVGVYFLVREEQPVEAPVEEVLPEEAAPVKEELEQVHMYPMEPFFLPFWVDDVETGKFISITPSLLLSNSALHKEIDKVLPLVRKNIYTILKRKTLHDFTVDKLKAEERLKQEILTTANALLLSGTGTVTDIFFTEFVVK